MTTTAIYAVKQDEAPICIGNCQNAWRGAMYVWNDIAERYFELECFPTLDMEMQSRIWNAANEKPLTKSEEIVLASTMDRAVVAKTSINKLMAAFDEYGNSHAHSSISEQLELIHATSIPDGYSLAWVQTSICEGWFKTIDEDTDEYVCNLVDSFDVIEQIEDEG